MRSRVLVGVASGLLGLALTGCGTGSDAATAANLTSAPGVSATDQAVAVRNAQVQFSPEGYPAGGDAPIELSVVNGGTEPVQLVDLSSPAAAEVTVTDVAYVGEQPGEPGGPPNGGTAPELLLAPNGLADVTLLATGLTEPLDGLTVLPLELAFDNGAALSLELPVATPAEPLPREPLDLSEEEGH